MKGKCDEQDISSVLNDINQFISYFLPLKYQQQLHTIRFFIFSLAVLTLNEVLNL